MYFIYICVCTHVKEREVNLTYFSLSTANLFLIVYLVTVYSIWLSST